MTIKRTVAILGLALFLAGCANTYRVTTYEGKVYETKGKPQFDEETKTYRFQPREEGRVIVPQKDVKEIKELVD